MSRKGPIILIEDDPDDQDLFLEVFKKLNYPNEVLCFPDGYVAFEFLKTSELMPFVILSDINLPRLDGFALRDKIRMDANLQLKCIPYIFFSTAANQRTIIEAYGKSIQGFFVKDVNMADLEETISLIMGYWAKCISPNNF